MKHAKTAAGTDKRTCVCTSQQSTKCEQTAAT